MNIQQLQGFVLISKTRSITRAAEQMHLTQQALSKSIARLEEEMGAELFYRIERQTVLTELGKKLLPVVESLLAKYDEHVSLMQDIIEQNTHSISIAFENAVLLNGFPPELLTRMGDIGVNGYIGTDNSGCIRDVAEKRTTCAFVLKPPDLRGLRYYPVLKRYANVIMSKNHPLAKKQILFIEDLRNENHSWLSINSQSFYNYYKACMEAGFYPKITKEYPSAELQHQDLPNGMEITVGGGFVYTDREPELVRRPLKNDTCMIEAGFLYRPEDERNNTLNSYFRVVKQFFETK